MPVLGVPDAEVVISQWGEASKDWDEPVRNYFLYKIEDYGHCVKWIFLYIHSWSQKNWFDRSQVCDNRDCHWELSTGHAVGEGESGVSHLPCTNPHYWYEVSSEVLQLSLKLPPCSNISNVTYNRSYFEAMRWLHKTGRWDRDVSAADRVIPNSMKPHEVGLHWICCH